MSVSNSVFVLRLLTTQELITSSSTNTYKVSGPKFARRCVVKWKCYLRQKRKKSTNHVLYAILAHNEKLSLAVNGRFMHRRSQMLKPSRNFCFFFVNCATGPVCHTHMHCTRCSHNGKRSYIGRSSWLEVTSTNLQ